MSEIEDRLRSIQARMSSAQAQRARAEVEVEHAKKARDEAKETLKNEFGVVTSDDLKSLRAELTKELEDSIAEAESALNDAGA